MAAIEVTGLNETIAACKQAPQLITQTIQPAVEGALLSLLPDLASYPSPPANSAYRRTGTLGRTWTAAKPEFQAISSGFEARIGNPTPYAPFVQGTPQARMHRGRWEEAEKIAEKHTGDMEQRIQGAVDRLSQELGG